MGNLMGNNMFKTLLKISNYYESKAKKILSTVESKRTWDLKHLLGPEDFEPNKKPIKGLTEDKQQHILKALEETGAKAIPRGEHGSPVLGEGQFGIVVDVVYNGHQAAMKITDDENDANNYKKMQEVYKTLPNFIKRHVPQIYLTKKIQNGFSDIFVTIMEHLVPMPSGITLQGWGQDISDAKHVEIITDKIIDHITGNIYSIVNNAINDKIQNEYITSIIFEELKKIDEFNDLADSKTYRNYVNLSSVNLKYNNERLRGLITESLMEVVGRALRKSCTKILGHLNSTDENYEELHKKLTTINNYSIELTESIVNQVVKNLNLTREFFNPLFNRTYIEKPSETLKDPRLAKLYVALKWLIRNQWVDINDMHIGNVMYRPSTDDLVVADIGLWQF